MLTCVTGITCILHISFPDFRVDNLKKNDFIFVSVGDWFKSTMAEDGLDIDNMKHRVK